MKESLDFIYKEQKELSTLGGVAALLGWDQLTYMPLCGATERSEQSAYISRISHDKIISDEFWNHVKILIKPENFSILPDNDKAVAARLERDLEKARKIPSSFVEKMSKTTSLAYQAWEEARKKNNFIVFASHLEKIVELEKEYCGFINLPGPRYNSLLDDYEEGMTVDILRKEFEFLKINLIELLDKIKSSSLYEKQSIPDVKFDLTLQRKISNLIVEKMKLPMDKARIDVSTHPFTTSLGNDDIRITTNYDRPGPLFSFFSTVHEAGHALYELGMPRDKYIDTVISDSPSVGLHESQSRFWENMIARSKYFWKYFYPEFKKISPASFTNVSFNDWYRFVNQVKPSLIRVDADELTYCLHVILRFEIEVALMQDEIKVSELPMIWNEKIDEMLGVIPTDDKEGVLQDMHWGGGNFGYFPTYVIGTIYSAQLFNKLAGEKPEIYNEIENGEFGNILSWLRENVHRYGRLMTADEIIKKTCGEGLNSKVFIDYLTDKYLGLYEV